VQQTQATGGNDRHKAKVKGGPILPTKTSGSAKRGKADKERLTASVPPVNRRVPGSSPG